MVSPLCLVSGFILSDVSLGTRPRYNLVADEDVKNKKKKKKFLNVKDQLRFLLHTETKTVLVITMNGD